MTETSPQLKLAFMRTHLANERTFAAWLRTGLSLAAAGLAIGKLGPGRGLALIPAQSVATVLVAAGAVSMLIGLWSYNANYRMLCASGAQRTAISRLVIIVLSLTIFVLVLLVLAAL